MYNRYTGDYSPDDVDDDGSPDDAVDNYSPDDVVDDDRIWWLQQLVEATRNLIKLHPCALKYLTQQDVLAQCHKSERIPITLP